MDVRQLRFFLAVAEHGSLTGAADALHMGQASISHALRALEEELGVRLFRRRARGMDLTPGGTALLDPARQVVARSRETYDAVHRVENLEGGRLDLATTADLAVDPLAGFIETFRSQYPAVRIDVLHANDPTHAAELVREATCEIALCSRPADHRGVGWAGLGERPLLLALAPDQLWTDGRPVPVAKLAEIPLVAAPTGDVVRDLLDEACATLGIRTDVRVEVEMLPVHPALVAHGAGAAVLPPALAEEARQLGAHVRSLDPPLTQEYGFLFWEDGLTAASRAFVDLVGLLHRRAR